MPEHRWLFDPVAVGGQELQNRIVLPPLTRSRASEDGTPTPMMGTYYGQRSSAGLIITEGTVILPQATAYRRVPGLYSEDQAIAWRPIVEAARHEGNAVYCQLWHVGRQSHSMVQPDGLPPYGPSPVRIAGYTYRSPEGKVPFETPRELTREQIDDIVAAYGTAARNAALAGFDGIELHGANGYLIEQFLDDGINRRHDEYGGDIESRLRFLLEVIDAVAEHFPHQRIGVRLSPSSNWMDAFDSDKRALFSTVIARLNTLDLAYLHLVEPGIAGSTTAEHASDETPTAELAALFTNPVVVTGGHTQSSAERLLASGVADLVGFGRLFIANPDLPERFRVGAPLNEVRSHGLYDGGRSGYIDYPTLDAARL